MKLCWENLENIKLSYPAKNSARTEPELALYTVSGKFSIFKCFIEVVDHCEYCGESFLKPSTQTKFNLCDDECRKSLMEERAFGRQVLRYLKSKNTVKIRADKRKKKMAQIKLPYNTVSYHTANSSLGPYGKEIRRAKDDCRLAEIKCDNPECNEWIQLTKYQYDHLKHSIYGNRDEISNNTNIYCGHSCRKHCRGNLSIDELLMDDLWKAGHYKEAYEIKQRISPYKPVEVVIKCKLAKQYKKPKRKWKKKKKTTAPHYSMKIKCGLPKELKVRKRERKAAVYREYMKTDEYKNKHRQQIKDRYEKIKREDPKRHTLNKLLYYSRARSKQKGFKNHDLTYEWLAQQVANNCPKTGIEFRYKPSKYRDPYAPSIDRIDNNKGYTKENCQVVIWAYNCAKATWSDELLYIILKKVI